MHQVLCVDVMAGCALTAAQLLCACVTDVCRCGRFWEYCTKQATISREEGCKRPMSSSVHSVPRVRLHAKQIMANLKTDQSGNMKP